MSLLNGLNVLRVDSGERAHVYVTLAAYPLVPRSQVGFRVQVTAANTDEEIDHLDETPTRLADRFAFQRREAA